MVNETEVVELCTFPDDDDDYCKSFTVPRDWLECWLENSPLWNNTEYRHLDAFLEVYEWDDTWWIYNFAKTGGKLIREEAVK